MSETKLLPCPFCGKKPGMQHFNVHPSCRCRIICRCGAEMRNRSEAEAIAAWNRRISVLDFESWNTRAERTCHMEQMPECQYDDIACSECGVALWAFSMDKEGEGVLSTPKYCPNCGAKVVQHD